MSPAEKEWLAAHGEPAARGDVGIVDANTASGRPVFIGHAYLLVSGRVVLFLDALPVGGRCDIVWPDADLRLVRK